MKTAIIALLFLILTVSISAQWEWQNPTTTGNSLNNIECVTQSIFWTVGEAGVILKTTDGGNTWITQSSGTFNNLNSATFIDTMNGWVVGQAGTILKTSNSESQWQNIVNDFDEYNLTSVSFINQNVGWIVGGKEIELFNDKSVIIKTTDGGLTWSEQWETTIYLNTCFFLDENTGWVAGGNYNEGNKIYKTVNGGITWELQYSNSDGSFNDAFFLNPNVGYIVGNHGLLLKTQDGGINWNQINSGTLNPLYQIKFLDSNLGWIVGYTCLHTNDGGATWIEYPFPEGSQSFKSIDILNEDELFTVGRRGRILKSINGGYAWERISGFLYSLYSVYFSDTLWGIAASDQGNFLFTPDGGVNWNLRNTSTSYTFWGLFMLNQNIGWAIAPSHIFKTTDGGNNWLQKYYYPYNYFRDIYFIDSQNGWACGGHETILHSSDGGETWSQQYSNTFSGEITTIQFISENIGFAAGHNDFGESLFYKTIDGGMSWDSLHIFVNNVNAYGPSKIQFENESNGWLLMSNCLLKTTDGGIKWNSLIYIKGYTDFNDISFSGDNIWIVGDYGLILNTTNSGQTWGVQKIDNVWQYPSNWFYSISMVNENSGWVVGRDGAVLKTTNGGHSLITFPSIPSLIEPYNNSIMILEPSYSWNKIDGALYQLQISKESDFESLEFEGTSLLNLIHPYLTYVDSTQYFWRVRSMNQIGESEWSDTWSFSTGIILGIQNEIDTNPTKFSLYQNYPNPFNPVTKIKYSIPAGTRDRVSVQLKVYDILGREIVTLVNEEKPAGEYEVEFNGSNLPSGIYFYQLKTESFVETKKMVLIK